MSDPEDPHSELAAYRFRVVPFGTTSSPFMLHATLDLHLNQFDTPVAKDMKRNLYVDNLMSGCTSEEEIVTYYQQARSIMNRANFNLRSWSSNSKKLQAMTSKDQTNDQNHTVNLLGLCWDTYTDTLTFAPRILQSIATPLVTKRDVLRDSSLVYDPLGFLTPVTVKSKIFLQTLWKEKLDWDEPLDTTLTDQWLSIAKDIQTAATTVHPRSYFAAPPSNDATIQLHVFTDASTVAYGSVAYISFNHMSTLVMSRSRVAPLKPLTLPKLELMAAVTGVRLTNFVKDSLIPHIGNLSVFLWSDSQIVLHWIHHLKSSTQAKPFIANRIQEIKDSFPAEHWGFVPSSDNPADLLTRGLSIQQLQSSQLWLHGPSWLASEDEWPTWSPNNMVLLQTDDVTDTSTNCEPPTESTQPQQYGLHNVIDTTRYSQLTKLLTVTIYVYRFCNNLRHPSNRSSGPITAKEFSNARLLWIKNCQSQVYTNEITSISTQQRKRLPLVRQLRLFLDREGYLRCGGRIHNAPVSELTKFPYLLPPKCHFTNLLILATHQRLCHSGINSTVTALRQSYWIPAIRQVVRRLLRKCVTCLRVMGKPYQVPDPPPLPKLRIEHPNPFQVTGVDFTGALYIRSDEGEAKVYICLFTCSTTRAVHLEVVTDLTVESFMLAFRRFSSRRSTPRTMISDNASTYLAAADELRQLFQSPSLKEALEYRGVSWKFIPKRAPWYGGFWERLVGLTKQALKKVLGRSFVTMPVLQTIVTEIECILNDRPVTYVSSDVSDIEPLTPAHLLCGRKITSLPHSHEDAPEDPDYIDGTTMRKQLSNHTRILMHFQSRWRKEYLTSLREFHRAVGNNQQRVKVGDVILIHDDKPRLNWKLAVIKELVEGNDGLVRAANVRTKNGITSRPIAKLYPLEVSSEISNNTPNQGSPTISDQTPIQQDESTVPSTSTTEERRPTRDAARRARKQIMEWSRELCRPPEDVEK